MNLLNLLAHLLSGLLAGYASWMSLREGTPWAFGGGFLATLFSTGIFSACFVGFSFSLLSLGNEMRYSKALRYFSTGAATGLAIPMTGAVLFSLVFDVMDLHHRFPDIVIRCLWWVTLSGSIAGARGIALGNSKAGMISFLGLAPGLLLAGLLFDRFFVPRELFLVGSIVLGLAAGSGLGIGLELLKEAWLESSSSSLLRAQYILETEEFTAGRGDHFDMSLSEGPKNRFVIIEKEGIHFIEVLADEPLVLSGGGRFRYRVLCEGDAIIVDDQVWIYHTRYMRTRDALPQAV